MSFYLSIPFLFLKFWYKDIPLGLIRFFSSLNSACLEILSLPILASTFFKPLKNEYRKGLVVFSIFMGVAIKTFLIIFDLIIFLIIISLEAVFILLLLLWPVLTLIVLFL